jgi:hypothetical protein
MIGVDAEAALFAVNELRTMLPPKRRWSWMPWARVEERQDRILHELLFARLIGAGENYFLIHATRLLQPDLLDEVPPPDPPNEMTEKLRNAAKDFRQVEALWKKQLNVVTADLDGWKDFDQSREVRHILVHRLGRWQPGLSPKAVLESRIAALGENPATYRGAFPLGEADCRECADTVLKVVGEAEMAIDAV